MILPLQQLVDLAISTEIVVLSGVPATKSFHTFLGTIICTDPDWSTSGFEDEAMSFNETNGNFALSSGRASVKAGNFTLTKGVVASLA